MLDLDKLKSTLIDEGRAQVFVRIAGDYGLTIDLAHTLLDLYPDHFIIWQRRQNDAQDYRITLADQAEEQLLSAVAHPYQPDFDRLDAAYDALFAKLGALGLGRHMTKTALERIYQVQYQALAQRPHPCNPYVQVGWMAGSDWSG